MVMEVMSMTIGEKIYKFRIYLGLSQKDFANKVGTHNLQLIIGKMEKDSHESPNSKKLQDLLIILYIF